jgi:hypothetical protein
MRNRLLSTFALSLLAFALAAAESLALGQEAGTYSIRGSVVTTAGRPAASVWVVVERDGYESGRALTADDGRYYVSRLRPGSYTIEVRRGAATLYRAQVRLPEDAVHDIVLR